MNLAGTGVDSAPSAVVRIGGPTAPNVVAISTSHQVALTWTTPANNGAKIASYAITVFTGGVAQAGLAHTITCSQPCTPATNWTVTGLTNGTLYTFKVAAINSRGSGAVGTTAVKASATAIKPGAPTAVVATAGAATANIAWVAPSNGSATITAYVVTPFVNGVAQSALVQTFSAPVSLVKVTALTSGVTYTFTIAANNAAGTGAASAPSNPATIS